MRKTIGIVGATGATGQQVLAALQNHGENSILLGGRNVYLLNALAVKSGAVAKSKILDVTDPASLDAFCSQVKTIVNCAGPVSVLGDLVARAALRNRCNYVDAAGLSIVSESLISVKDEIQKSGLSFVVSAGWMPGLSELLPAYAYDLAKKKFGSVERVSVYFGDWGHWSDNAIADVVWFMRKRRLQSPGTFRRGVWKADRSVALRKGNLGEPLVEGNFASFYTPELESLGKAITDADFGAWAHYCDRRGLFLAAAVALLPYKQTKAMSMIRKAYSGYQQPVGGFAIAKAETKDGKNCTVTANFGKGRDYEVHGAVLATAASLIGHQAVLPGVNYFWQAFNRPNVVEWLKTAGVRITETYD
jgi:saccharopine dehydrogenase (NAD+, L-lysine-forming)